MRKEIYEKNGNQESSDTLPFHWEFGKEEITLKVSSYAYGNGLAVLMYSQSEGELELFGDLTVNLPGGYGLEPQEAIDLFIENKIMYAPGKAVNAGGVATSGLEMSQNAMHLSWSAAEVDEKLHAIMHGIHAQCVKYGTEPDGYINYVKGANIAGFMKVAHAMMGQGII